MGNAIQCRARMVGDGVDAQCQIWTNADPQGRHVGDHDAPGTRWTASSRSRKGRPMSEPTTEEPAGHDEPHPSTIDPEEE
jgi:hypothetical protein